MLRILVADEATINADILPLLRTRTTSVETNAVRTVCNIFAHATIPSMFRGTVRIWCLSLIFALVPIVGFAQTAGIPEKIVPCSGAVAKDNMEACTVCHLATLAQNLLNSAIFLAVFISAILFAYAGWLYLTNEAIQGQAEARGLFKDVVLGLIIILGAWLFVDTIMKTLMGSTNYLPWNSICGNGMTPGASLTE